MKDINKYYVRVYPEDNDKFEEYLDRNGITGKWLSTDMGPGKGSSMYSLDLSDNQASAMKLSFNLIGCLNLKKALDAQLDRRALAHCEKPV